MDSVRVLTNETCNQNCAFCNARRPFERPGVAAFAAVRARITASLHNGAREIVLTGGEPTLRRDLLLLVAYAKRAGAREVVLETNGALIDEPRAAALAAAGLDRARIHIPVWGDACDAITRDEGGFARTRAALDALSCAGIVLEIAAPVVQANVRRLPELPGQIAASRLPVRALVLGVPVSAPDEGMLVPFRRAAEAIDETFAASRSVPLAVRIDPNGFIPPCLFPHPSRVAGLYSLTWGGGGWSGGPHPSSCDGCSVLDRCPGVPRAATAREPSLAWHPITDEKTRRRLSLVSTVEAQIERELLTRDLRVTPAGETVRESIVRVIFQCNQACRFCFVSTHLPAPERSAIENAIGEIGRERGRLSLSGGEPTLDVRLVEYVRLGKRLGARGVELQTNGTRLADGTLTRALVEAGVDVFFVSLHASNAEISDAITEAPGTFARTVSGIDEIARTSARLRLNVVFCEKNQDDFPCYVRMVARRWPRAEVSISFVAPSTDLVPRERSLIPRYSSVIPSLAEGVHAARELGVVLTGFRSMCGIPLCRVPEDLLPFLDLSDPSPGSDPGEFLKVDGLDERRPRWMEGANGLDEVPNHGRASACSLTRAAGFGSAMS